MLIVTSQVTQRCIFKRIISPSLSNPSVFDPQPSQILCFLPNPSPLPWTHTHTHTHTFTHHFPISLFLLPHESLPDTFVHLSHTLPQAKLRDIPMATLVWNPLNCSICLHFGDSRNCHSKTPLTVTSPLYDNAESLPQRGAPSCRHF